jgi:hypothetical protein
MMKHIQLNFGITSEKLSIALLLLSLSVCFGCKEESPLPILETKVANVFGRSAISGGTVITRKTAAIHETGVCWSTNKTPDINGAHTTDGVNYSVYVSVMEDLAPGTEYYYRAYAISSDGVAYGNTLKMKTNADNSSFLNTDSLVSVTLRTVQAFASYKLGYTLKIKRNGFCYAAEPMPTINDNVFDYAPNTSSGYYSYLSFDVGSTMYVRAFVELENGTVYYGEPLSVNPGNIEITAVDRITFRSARIIIENDPHPNTSSVKVTHPHSSYYGYFYGAGATTYYANVSNLKPDTTYSVSAWLRYYGYFDWVNDYAGTVSFTTLPLPYIGNGSYEDPYTVDGALYHTSFPGHVWVEGCIVGEYDTNIGNFTPPFGFRDNILIAGDAEEIFRRNTVQIDLPQGPVRDALNLKENPVNKGKTLKIQGLVYRASNSTITMTGILDFEIY